MPRARLLLLLLLLCRCQWGVAQRECSTLFGIGRANQYDTYLSPLEYRGPQMSMLHITLRPLLGQPRVEFRTLTQLEYSYSHNPSGSTHEHAGAVRFDAGWSRRWSWGALPRLSLSAGGLVGADVGFLYNLRNSNNPAQARAGVRLSAAVGAAYELRLGQKSLHIDYNASLPLMGGMFSPQYGQSYYNIFSQGNYDHNVVFTHPGNSLSLRQRLTVSLTVRKRRVTVGYVSDLLQAEPHHLRQHQYSRSLLVGWGVEKGR